MITAPLQNRGLSFSAGIYLNILLVLLAGTGSIRAQQLPIKTFTSADGLAQNNVNRIVMDSRGFLWICTGEGLSRYDGYKFTNYGVDQGLPHRNINDLLETSTGEYWLATNDGLVYFNPKGKPVKPAPEKNNIPADADSMFTVLMPAEQKGNLFVTVLLQDRNGVVWCGAKSGLLRLEKNGSEYALATTPLWDALTKEYQIESLLTDHRGAVWAGSFGKIFKQLPGGGWRRFGEQEGMPKIEVNKLLEDGSGSIWVGTGSGLMKLVADPQPGASIIEESYSIAQGLPGTWVRDLWLSPDKTLWVATDRGLCNFSLRVASLERRCNSFTKENGLSDYYLKEVVGDSYGNLWLGTANAGVMKIFFEGFTTYGQREGVLAAVSAFKNSRGELYFIGYASDNGLVRGGNRISGVRVQSAFTWAIGRFDKEKIVWVRPNVPGDVLFSWGWNQVSFQDSEGEWWIATRSGLYRFPKVDRFEDLAVIKPKSVYTVRDGLKSDNIIRLYEDSRRDIWISASSPSQNGLAKWERSSGKLIDLTMSEGLPSLRDLEATAFREDGSGTLWIGFGSTSNLGGLARYRDGRFSTINHVHGSRTGNIVDLFFDHSGKLWVASNVSGLSRVDDPSAASPDFIHYTTADGLSSNKVTTIAEDGYRRIYAGTGRGVDRIEPATNSIRHFTQADGLTLGGIDDILVEKDGSLLFATTQGLSRLVPRPSPSYPPPEILIDGVRVRGEERVISALGEIEVFLPGLDSSDNQIEIDFVGLSFVPGDKLRYQTKLEGIDHDWRPATEQRSINFANLAPGGYRFLVRAVNADNAISPRPAGVNFRILRPVWQRWWFLMLAALGLALTGFAVYRLQVNRLLEVERIRTRIATDLHDDIGASLSQIAILSEVSRQRAGDQANGAAEPLSQIANTSRDLVDSMSDIVWAINPQRDRLSDLSQRMREFAGDVLGAREIEFSFHAPSEAQQIKLDAELRRQLYLIFKEAINNIARHSQCTEAVIDFEVEENSLKLIIQDNGRGFDPANARDGNGLKSISERVRALGGEAKIISRPNHGATIALSIPFKQSARSRRRYLPV